MRHRREEAGGTRGAALVTVLAFMTLTFILITSMLALTGNEILLAGIQRDGVRALDLAQAGAQEAIHRMAEGRPHLREFSASLDTNGAVPPNATVSVVRHHTGTNAGYVEVRATASAGLSTRRITVLALQRGAAMPPNIVLAESVVQQEGAEIACGDVYARGFVQYWIDPNRAASRCPAEPPGQPSVTYAGWRVSVCADPGGPCSAAGEVPPCYRAPCPASLNADTSRWYPATRLAVPEDSPVGRELGALVNRCPAGGGGSLPGDRITGRLASEEDAADLPRYGFDLDDPDGPGPAPPQAVVAGILPCGLPYRYEPVAVATEDGRTVQRYAKTVIFEQWFPLYWRFDEHRLIYARRAGAACADAYCLPGGVEPDLAGHAKFGAVPPFPQAETITASFDCRKAGGGTLQGAQLSCDQPAGIASTFGCKAPEMACAPPESRPVSLVLEGGWVASGLQGHGTLVVDGDLAVAGGVSYWGTVSVTGSLAVSGLGTVLRGGVIAAGPLRFTGSVRVEGGGTTPSPPLGRSRVTVRGWWER